MTPPIHIRRGVSSRADPFFATSRTAKAIAPAPAAEHRPIPAPRTSASAASSQGRSSGRWRSEMEVSDRLAVERTSLAFERTLLAWIRTAIALIAFGFSIYKYFQLQRVAVTEPPAHRIGSREFAVLMISAGLSALLLGMIEYMSSMRRMRGQYAAAPRLLPLWLGGLIAILGMAGLVAVLLDQ